MLNILSIDFASSRRRDHFPFHCAVINRVSGKIDQVVGYVDKGENVDMIISIAMHLVMPKQPSTAQTGLKTDRGYCKRGFILPTHANKGKYLNDNRQVCCHIVWSEGVGRLVCLPPMPPVRKSALPDSAIHQKCEVGAAVSKSASWHCYWHFNYNLPTAQRARYIRRG